MKNINNQNSLKSMADIIFIALLLAVSLFSSCEEELGDTDKTPPPLPANIQQKEAISGGAIITYDVPEVIDLLYIQARYVINGVERISKSTTYENTLTVSGFGEIKEYDVWISSVDKSGNRSDESKITVTPLTPPADLAFSTMKVEEAFGGIAVSLTNEAEATLIVETAVKDTLGFWQVLDSRATDKENEEFIIKDGVVFLDDAQEFKIYIKDRWDNVSDTLPKTLKPLFEELIDFNHIETSSYADDDDSWPGSLYLPRFVTDGISTNNNNYIYHSGPNTNFPVSLTIDLGTEIKISSYKMFTRYNYEYRNHCFKSWQIWARADAPPLTTDADPDFAPAKTGWEIGDTYANVDGDPGWTLISQAATTRPSGPDGPVTSEDIAYGRAGEIHAIPINIAKSRTFRYVKLCIQTSYSNSYAAIAEMSFYGEYQGEKPN